MDSESSTPPPPGQAAGGRRRITGLVLVVVVVVIAGWLAMRRPVDCELSLAFGARAVDVRAVKVTLREGSAEGPLVRTISLQLPPGPPAPIARRVRLRPGSYRAEAVLTDGAGRERTVRRTLTVERDECALTVDLGD